MVTSPYTYVALTSPVIALFFLFYKREKWDKTAVVVGLLLGLNLFTDYFSVFMWWIESSSFLVFEFYSILLCWILLELYKTEINNKKLKKGFLAFQISYTVFALYQYRHLQDAVYIELPYTVLSTTAIMLSIYYFYYTFIRMEVVRLERFPMFWINSAILIYFGGTFFVTLFEDIAREFGVQRVRQMWVVQHNTSILVNLIMARGTWEMRRI